MRILVVGGTGFMGPEVVRQLVARGHEVAVFHRGVTQASLPAGVREIIGDRQNLPQFSAEFRGFKPDVAIDVICASEHQARTSMDVFRGLAGRIAVLSSCDVYRAYDVFRRKDDGPLEPVPLTESSPLRRNLYPYRGMNLGGSGYITDDYDKILAERAVMNDSALPATVLRLPMVYGPGDQYHRFWPYIKRMEDRRPAILLNEATAAWRSTWGYVLNVAAAIALAAENRHAAGRIYNVSDASRPTMADWVRDLAKVTGWRGSLEIISQPCPPPSLGPEYNAKQDLVCDSSRIRQELGYVEPISRQEALQSTVRWDRENPPAQTDSKQFDYAAEDEISRVRLKTRERLAHPI